MLLCKVASIGGVIGLDICIISLLAPTLTEEDLLSLFNTMPRRCVVLLEDIDTAGLGRPAASRAKASSEQRSQAEDAPARDADEGGDGAGGTTALPNGR